MTEKEIAVKRLRELLTQASYGNIYQNQIESFIDAIVSLIKSDKGEEK